MFVKKEILAHTFPTAENHTDNSIRVEIFTIGKEPTLCTHFYKRGELRYSVYVQGDKWINYIHAEEKFNNAKLFFHCTGYNKIDIWRNDYSISTKELNLMSKFLKTKAEVSSCLKVLKEYQKKAAWDREEKAFRKCQVNSAEAKEIFSKLPIPKLSQSEMEQTNFHNKKVYIWKEIQDYPYEPAGEILATMGYCTSCGNKVEMSYNTHCPECGNGYLKKITSKRLFTDSGNIAKLYKYGDVVYCVLYRVERNTEFLKKGRYLKYGFIPSVSYCSFPRDVYIMSGQKFLQMSAWEQASIMGTKYYNGGSQWYYKERTVWPWDARLIDFDEEMFYSTKFKHAHLAEILDCCNNNERNTAVLAVKYLKLYKKYPNIENLVTNNFGAMVMEMVFDSSKTKVFNLSAKKLNDITGLNRTEQARCHFEEWTVRELEVYKAYRDKKNKILPAKELKEIAKMDLSKAKRLTDDIFALGLYMIKQENQPQYWIDYIKMAQKLGLNIENPLIKYPKDLRGKHDELVQKIKWNENKELIEKFKTIAKHLHKLSFEKDGICIRIAESENELISEGKILKHCVGGYGKYHTEGKSIFFIRKANEKTTPWYTLQVNLKTGARLQLHGYENDRIVPIPKEVHDFVDYWFKNVFCRFDVDKMEFIDKPKKTKRAV